MPEQFARIDVSTTHAISGDGRAVLVRMSAPKLFDTWLLASTDRQRLDQLAIYRPGMILGRPRRH